MKFREKKNVLIYFFLSFTNFKGIQGFLLKIPGYFQSSSSQNKFQASQGFQGAVGTLTSKVSQICWEFETEPTK